MDFQSLNRRELQSLCKLNKIPANMTNVAMANALKSLETVEGIEEILNPSRSEAGSSIESPEKMEVTSPRVPRTSCRTSTRQKLKKAETESQPATASRTTACGVRRKLGGDVNEYMKTPSISSTRKKAPTTCSRQNGLSQLNECGESVKKETTVQRVYNTRRSARLTEKKRAETGVMQTERTQPVKIDSFLEEMSVTSENVGSDYCSMETSHESNENTKDIVGEESDDACVSKAKVEEICNEFEKLDVVVDESDQKLDLEKNVEIIEKHNVEINESEPKVDLEICNEFKKHNVKMIEKHENVNLEDEHNVGQKFVMNEIDNSEDKSSQVDDQKPDSEVISYPCEDSDEESEENLTVTNEQIDLNESPNVSDNVQSVYFATEEEKSGPIENLKPDLEDISNSSEDWDLIDDLTEVLDVSVKEQKVDSDAILFDVVVDESDQKVDIEDICNVEIIEKHENVNLEDEHKFVINKIDNSERKPGSEEKLIVSDEQIDPNESLNVSDDIQIIYFAPDEEKSGQIDNLIPDLEDVSNPSKDDDSIDEALTPDLEDISIPSEDSDSVDDLNEALNVSVKEQKVDSDANTENPNDTSILKLEDISNEMINNGYTNMEDLIQSNTSEVSKLDKPEEMTAVGIEDNTSTCTVTVDADFVNPNEQEPDTEFKPPVEKEQESLTAIDVMPTKYEQLYLDSQQFNQEKQNANANDVVIDLAPLNHQSIKDIRDKDENINEREMQVEDDKNIDEKPKISSDTISIRQLKKQLKALSINTNKVSEARPALQAVCDNPLANGEDN